VSRTKLGRGQRRNRRPIAPVRYDQLNAYLDQRVVEHWRATWRDLLRKEQLMRRLESASAWRVTR
jgi:hypothetical protein